MCFAPCLTFCGFVREMRQMRHGKAVSFLMCTPFSKHLLIILAVGSLDGSVSQKLSAFQFKAYYNFRKQGLYEHVEGEIDGN